MVAEEDALREAAGPPREHMLCLEGAIDGVVDFPVRTPVQGRGWHELVTCLQKAARDGGFEITEAHWVRLRDRRGPGALGRMERYWLESSKHYAGKDEAIRKAAYRRDEEAGRLRGGRHWEGVSWAQAQELAFAGLGDK